MQDHSAAAAASTVSGWGLFLTSLATNSLPFLQMASLVLAIAASCYAIRYYRKRT
jgi:hypothetical protein